MINHLKIFRASYYVISFKTNHFIKNIQSFIPFLKKVTVFNLSVLSSLMNHQLYSYTTISPHDKINKLIDMNSAEKQRVN